MHDRAEIGTRPRPHAGTLWLVAPASYECLANQQAVKGRLSFLEGKLATTRRKTVNHHWINSLDK